MNVCGINVSHKGDDHEYLHMLGLTKSSLELLVDVLSASISVLPLINCSINNNIHRFDMKCRRFSCKDIVTMTLRYLSSESILNI